MMLLDDNDSSRQGANNTEDMKYIFIVKVFSSQLQYSCHGKDKMDQITNQSDMIVTGENQD